LVRFSYRRLIYYLRRQGLFVRRALVVGTNEEGRAVVAQLRASPAAGVDVVGFVEPAMLRGEQVEGVPVLSGLHRLESLIRSLEVEDLIVIPTALRRDELLDLVVSLVTVILLAPVFLVISILIRRDSPGPATYRRRVVGLAGRGFDAYKFRTMIPDADAYLKAHPELNKEWEQSGKIQDDPRITRVGRFLRRYSLDELPQLLNVLRGQMSLVGPRMITPEELKHFGRWRHNLLTVKPGMTGLWQVSGRSDLSYEERVRLDMQYIRNYTAWTDFKLIFDTVWAVLKGRGAY
jgi:lipopolysaccharide/colanic/teichoic acid biosynthesis glycosyltransferase